MIDKAVFYNKLSRRAPLSDSLFVPHLDFTNIEKVLLQHSEEEDLEKMLSKEKIKCRSYLTEFPGISQKTEVQQLSFLAASAYVRAYMETGDHSGENQIKTVEALSIPSELKKVLWQTYVGRNNKSHPYSLGMSFQELSKSNPKIKRDAGMVSIDSIFYEARQKNLDAFLVKLRNAHSIFFTHSTLDFKPTNEEYAVARLFEKQEYQMNSDLQTYGKAMYDAVQRFDCKEATSLFLAMYALQKRKWEYMKTLKKSDIEVWKNRYYSSKSTQ